MQQGILSIRPWGAEKNRFRDKNIKKLPGFISATSDDAEFFPGLSQSRGLTFATKTAPEGRPAGIGTRNRSGQRSLRYRRRAPVQTV
jgi:hypothetical protein